MKSTVMFPTGEAVTGKDLAPELGRIRGKSWEHKSSWDPHFDAQTFEMPGGPADKELAALTAAAMPPPKSPRKKRR